jgi:hypothetical protein
MNSFTPLATRRAEDEPLSKPDSIQPAFDRQQLFLPERKNLALTFSFKTVNVGDFHGNFSMLPHQAFDKFLRRRSSRIRRAVSCLTKIHRK